MEDNDAPNYIGPRENTLSLLVKLESALERDSIAWSTQDVARVRELLARLMVHLGKARSGVDESFPPTHTASDGDQPGGLASVTDGSSPKID